MFRSGQPQRFLFPRWTQNVKVRAQFSIHCRVNRDEPSNITIKLFLMIYFLWDQFLILSNNLVSLVKREKKAPFACSCQKNKYLLSIYFGCIFATSSCKQQFSQFFMQTRTGHISPLHYLCSSSGSVLAALCPSGPLN